MADWTNGHGASPLSAQFGRSPERRGGCPSSGSMRCRSIRSSWRCSQNSWNRVERKCRNPGALYIERFDSPGGIFTPSRTQDRRRTGRRRSVCSRRDRIARPFHRGHSLQRVLVARPALRLLDRLCKDGPRRTARFYAEQSGGPRSMLQVVGKAAPDAISICDVTFIREDAAPDRQQVDSTQPTGTAPYLGARPGPCNASTDARCVMKRAHWVRATTRWSILATAQAFRHCAGDDAHREESGLGGAWRALEQFMAPRFRAQWLGLHRSATSRPHAQGPCLAELSAAGVVADYRARGGREDAHRARPWYVGPAKHRNSGVSAAYSHWKKPAEQPRSALADQCAFFLPGAGPR